MFNCGRSGKYCMWDMHFFLEAKGRLRHFCIHSSTRRNSWAKYCPLIGLFSLDIINRDHFLTVPEY